MYMGRNGQIEINKTGWDDGGFTILCVAKADKSRYKNTASIKQFACKQSIYGDGYHYVS